MYVELHCHSAFSLLDGASDLGPAVALAWTALDDADSTAIAIERPTIPAANR